MAKDYKKAEEKLRDYVTGKLDAQMERRKEVLKYPPQPEEDLGVKVQTTRRNDQLESEVINYLEDRTYNMLKIDRDTIKRFLTYLVSHDHVTYQILTSFYRDRKSWVSIAHNLSMAESTCKYKRRQAISELTDWLNVG